MDVLLVDYHLPDGTAEDLIADFRDPTHGTCVLVMTGDTDPDLPVRLLAGGADAYLRKPFDATFAVELARKASRERAMLRIEAILESRTRELRASEERYRTLFETIPDLVLVLDRGGHVVQANPIGVRCLAGSGGDVLGRHILSLAPPARARDLARWISGLRLGRSAGSFQTELGTEPSSTLAVELTGTHCEFHGAPALLLVGRDTTERSRAEEERRRYAAQVEHAQRLESLGVLAGGVAHDFNNLLVGILGNASLAMMDLPSDSAIRESIEHIEVAARRAAELTQQILAFAGKTRVTTQDFGIAELVREMGQLLEPAASKKARISYRLATGLPHIRGDTGQIRQVVMNLIMNASDALEGRAGDITVTATLRRIVPGERFDAVGGGIPEPGPWIALEVTDDGKGMDSDTLHRIFEPFFTTKATGRGLGLAATLGIVRAHGGFISVRSRKGAGTTFTVLLPPVDARVTEGPRTHGRKAGWWSKGGRILVVDDEAAVRGLARAVLSRRGFTVTEASDGRAGLAAALAPGAPPDLVVLDVTMPEMDGIEALGALRARYPSLPILLSSGYPPEGIMDEARPTGPTGFLKKPYAASDLMDALSKLLVEEGAHRRPSLSAPA